MFTPVVRHSDSCSVKYWRRSLTEMILGIYFFVSASIAISLVGHCKGSNSVCFFVSGATAPTGLGSPNSQGFYITHNDTPQSVGPLWTSDQFVADTYTWQHTIITTNRHPCLRWDSNPQSQQASGRRPKPQTVRPLGPATLYVTSSFSSYYAFSSLLE